VDDVTDDRQLTFGWFIAGFIGLELVYLSVWLAPLVLVAYVLLVHKAERRRCRELRGGLVAAGECALGLGVGVLLCLLPFLWAITFGHARAISSLSLADLRYALVPTALYALAEEPIFRGLVLRYGETKLGSWWALFLSSALFAALHFRGPSYWSALFLGGAVFGAAYLLTRRLWLSIGLHTGCNVMMQLVFAQNVTHMPWRMEGVLQGVLVCGLMSWAAGRGLLVTRKQARETENLGASLFIRATQPRVKHSRAKPRPPVPDVVEAVPDSTKVKLPTRPHSG
jgi:membrane protease YdiL (CAAX protease family)